MICLGCKELHAGNDLAIVDAGVSFTLGDCRKSGTRHTWTKVKFVLDLPYTRTPGEYTLKRLTVEEAREFIGTGHVVSALLSQEASKFISLALDVPLIHQREKFFQFDVGDEALSLIVTRPWQHKAPMSALVEGKDYEFTLFRRIA